MGMAEEDQRPRNEASGRRVPVLGTDVHVLGVCTCTGVPKGVCMCVSVHKHR